TSYAKLLLLQNLAAPAGGGRWQEVEEAVDAVARKMPGAAVVDLLRAEILAAQKKYEDARRLLETTAAHHPKLVEVPVALAALSDRQGRSAAARAILDAAEKKFGAAVELGLARLQ